MADSSVVLRGRLVLFEDGTLSPATITVCNGKINTVNRGECKEDKVSDEFEVIDVGGMVLMPGIIDCHVHVNEPGRTDWEGYVTATKAAAVGGITTIVDMPLNSIPPTTTVDNFMMKLECARKQIFTDVAFWGGVVPGNQMDIKPLLNAGVVGFKCFLIHSGVEEFPHVTEADLHQAMEKLQGTNTVLLFHAEVEEDIVEDSISQEPTKYNSFLSSRPSSMEFRAIKLVCKLCLLFRVRCHIVHLSTASALPMIESARLQGAPLTVETCHHYLNLHAESIPDKATEYKCCPPIRDRSNQEQLWKGLKSGLIDLVISDHSPCTADLKCFDRGDFMSAWGGICGLQYGLSLFWTSAQRHGMGLSDIQKFLVQGPAKLSGLDSRKGLIRPGYDADFVIWDPHANFKVMKEDIVFKNKVTPYVNMNLQGVVHKTILAGEVVWDRAMQRFSGAASGKLLV